MHVPFFICLTSSAYRNCRQVCFQIEMVHCLKKNFYILVPFLLLQNAITVTEASVTSSNYLAVDSSSMLFFYASHMVIILHC